MVLAGWLLHICENYCLDLDIKLNAKKSKNLCFGKQDSPSFGLMLNGSPIEWVERWKYLGVSLIHGPRFGCCIDETISKFYRSANSILRVDGRSDDVVMLSLLETHCLPVLSYAIEVIHVADKKKLSKMQVAYNYMRFEKDFLRALI